MATTNLKTYRAATMAQALSEVKKDLGKDAVILHTRQYKVGAVMGVGGRQVIEITASDPASARGPRLREAAVSRTPRPAPLPPADDHFEAQSFATFAPAPGPDAGPDADPAAPVVRTRPIDPDAIVPRPAPTMPPPPAVAPPQSRPRQSLATRAPLAPEGDEAMASLQTELASIKRLVGQVLQCSRHTASSLSAPGAAPILAFGGLPDTLFALYTRLQDARVSIELADRVVGAVRDELTADELADPDIVRGAVLRHLAATLPVAGAMAKAGPRPGGRPLTIALIGPTGVGKTTTIAKLAAAYKLRQGKRVGLVTSDTYRIAAVDQLRTYANIIGLPLKVALTPGEMAACADSLADCDVVLVDTAGRSQRDADRLSELSDFLAAAAPDESHLVLSAAAAEPVMDAALDRFLPLGPTRLIVSKLDEAVHFGPIANILSARGSASGVRLSYVTTGQEVPDQIELAQPDRLARLILDGALPR